MEGQREKARAGSAFDGKKGEEFAFASDEAREALRQAGDVFEGYTDTQREGRAGARRSSTTKKKPSMRSNDGATGYAVLGAHAVLRRSRAARSPIRAGSRPRTAAARA